ncbi:MAG: hypothetical protein WCF85_06790 [Rhodospirillaceae bacterium]
MTEPLLPQQIAPVSRHQAALTRRYLQGQPDALFTYFLNLRTEVDGKLASVLPPAGGKPYPYGRCEEITRTLFSQLAARLRYPADPIESAIRAFVSNGGIVRTVWGALRGRYFQNALQFGALYIDVSNDTVVVTKPKVEILPMAESGMESLRDLSHFSEIAAIYWGATLWANTLVPSLAPLLPLISASPGRLAPGLQSAGDYMIALMCRDEFRQAETWLHDGPAPPPEIAATILCTLPEDLRPKTTNGRREAVDACRSARTAGHTENGAWRADRVKDFLRLMEARGN